MRESEREREKERKRESKREGLMRKGRMRKGDREELKTHEEEWKGVGYESETQREGA